MCNILYCFIFCHLVVIYHGSCYMFKLNENISNLTKSSRSLFLLHPMSFIYFDTLFVKVQFFDKKQKLKHYIFY